MKIKYNNEFKIINTEEKSYFLGYLFGDGCLSISKNKKSFNYCVSMTSKDRDIIDKILLSFPFFNLCKDRQYFKIYSYNKELFKDLENLGILKNKSTKNKDLLKIPKIDNTLIKHFIRGLYDSDGGFYLYNTLLETFFCSTSFHFINEVREWLLKNDIKTNLNKRKTKNSYIYYIRSKSNKAANKFYKLIYLNSKIYMDRKMETFLKASMISSDIKKSNYNINKKGTEKQLEKLNKDYKNIIFKFSKIQKIENPSLCCNYHTIESGKSHKKGTIRPLYLCLKCGKRSVYNRCSINRMN